MKWKAPHWPRPKNEYPAKPRGGVRGLQMTGAVIRFQLSHAKTTNEIQICFSITSHTKTKNEIQILYPKWCENEKRNSYPFVKVMRKRKTKFLPVFQSDERTKNKKQNSNLFFNVMQKRKTKNGNGIWMPFSHAIEKRLALRCTHCNATQHRRSIKTELWTKISVRFMHVKQHFIKVRENKPAYYLPETCPR